MRLLPLGIIAMTFDVKKTIALGASFGIAAVASVGIVAGVVHWLSSRPKSWDASSIKCTRLTVVPTYSDVPANPATGEKERVEVSGFSVEFVLENTTRKDYTLPADLPFFAREEPSSALTETQVKLAHSYVIPANERAEVDAHMDFSCGSTNEAGKTTPELECFNDAFVRISGFVGFDYSTHTRVDLPKPTFSPDLSSAAKALAK
jgi:hypothetical protein